MDEPVAPEQLSLFEHAIHLYGQDLDAPLPRDGFPFPDDAAHRGRRVDVPRDPLLHGAAAADLLAEFLADPHCDLDRVEAAFHAVDIPIHPNDHIRSVALRAEPEVARRTGRWLAQHGRDRCAVSIGLALLTARPNVEDAELVRTIGLLSERFAPLAAKALAQVHGGDESLVWLAHRSSGWGRVYYVEALCAYVHHRNWLLRHSCDGDFLNGYFAGKVAVATSLHEAITQPALDDELIDHTGRLLSAMAGASGMGTDLSTYPPASVVLSAYARNLALQEPDGERARIAVSLAHDVRSREPSDVGCSADERATILGSLDGTLTRPAWAAAITSELDRATWWATWAQANDVLPAALRKVRSDTPT